MTSSPFQPQVSGRAPHPIPVTHQAPVQHHAQGPAPVYVGRHAGRFEFDGGAGSFLLVGLGALLLTTITLGLAAPWATAMYYRWETNHTIIDGQRLRFIGSGGSLFGHYIKWWVLTIITLGIYSFWVWPRMVRWAKTKVVWGAQA